MAWGRRAVGTDRPKRAFLQIGACGVVDLWPANAYFVEGNLRTLLTRGPLTPWAGTSVDVRVGLFGMINHGFPPKARGVRPSEQVRRREADDYTT